MLEAEPFAHGRRGGFEGLQRVAELIAAGPGGQGIGVEGDDGLDARDPQLAGGLAGAPDPAAHGAVRDCQVTRDEPVPAPVGRGDQGLADQAGGVGAAGQQPGVEHDVGDRAAGAPGTVWAHRHGRAARLPDRPLPGPAPRPQRLAAAWAGQPAAGQRLAGRRGVQNLDHHPSLPGSVLAACPGKGQLVLQPGIRERPAQPGPG